MKPIVLALLASFAIRHVALSAQPNIIVIMADDMGFSDIGCYGGEIQTPNLDRLAAEGVRFTQFYNNAKCTTTRASLLSGMYPRGNGGSIPLDIPSIGEVMRGVGYQTALSGKWHLGSKAPQRPFDRGFDEYYGLMDGCCNFFNPAQPDPDTKGGKVRVFGHNDTLITEFPKDFYTTDAFAGHTSETIQRFHKTGKPFFIHLAFTAPHYPLHALPEDIAKYRANTKWAGRRCGVSATRGRLRWACSTRSGRSRPRTRRLTIGPARIRIGKTCAWPLTPRWWTAWIRTSARCSRP